MKGNIMLTSGNKCSIVVRSFFICLLILFTGCNIKIEHKIHIERRVIKMYEGYTKNPEQELVDRFNDFAESGSGSSLNDFRKAANKDIEFNEKCVEFISNDSILKVYFEGFIERHFEDDMNIYRLNYYGIPVRQLLQKELDVVLLK